MNLRKIPFLLIPVWLIIMLFMPFVEKWWGGDIFTIFISISVLAQATVVFVSLILNTGLKSSLFIAGVIISFTWFIEAIGASTGFPFGDYTYTDKLQPQLLGVPLLIPLAWLMMLPPSWAVARRIAGSSSFFFFALISGLAITAWDLFLDPQMVHWGLWTWHENGGYFGIPWINFAGWFLTAFIVTLMIRPKEIPVNLLFLVYILTWIMETAGLIIFWDLEGAALFGFLGMGFFVALSYFIYFRNQERFKQV
ncbi:carotenoid biosynthesis protein [Candidatus Poribacteria bacterium]|nr:carotenoid biosynthesis protein [Candidatus Poribacteria bacterium]